LINSVVLAGQTTTGADAIEFGYQNVLVANNIIVGVGASNSTGFLSKDRLGVSLDPTYYNNFITGFTFPYATRTGTVFPTINASNNAIDVAPGGGTTYTDAQGTNLTSAQFPGVNTSSGCGAGLASPCSGLVAANQLVNPTIGGSFDGRIKSSSADIYGAGVNFSTVSNLLGGGTYRPVTDILGSTWSPRWDIGAEKFGGAVVPPFLRLRWMGHP
jgi:hypothetical protein